MFAKNSLVAGLGLLSLLGACGGNTPEAKEPEAAVAEQRAEKAQDATEDNTERAEKAADKAESSAADSDKSADKAEKAADSSKK
ncbi:MAG: hypothetical protein ABW061_26515 [Polyangiaceae bacterium]